VLEQLAGLENDGRLTVQPDNVVSSRREYLKRRLEAAKWVRYDVSRIIGRPLTRSERNRWHDCRRELTKKGLVVPEGSPCQRVRLTQKADPLTWDREEVETSFRKETADDDNQTQTENTPRGG